MDMVPDKSSTGMEPNVAAGVSLICGWITGLIFFLIEKESKFVKFYAMQAIGLSLIMFVAGVLNVIPVLGQIAFGVIALGVFVMWIICLINAFGGKMFKVPVVGNFAAKQAGLE
jgi:uncharacterized membrane protein